MAADPNEYPPQIYPKWDSIERQWYLFESIRPFCPQNDQDVTCPQPTAPKPNSRAAIPADDNDPSSPIALLQFLHQLRRKDVVASAKEKDIIVVDAQTSSELSV